jgi:hypothetical protein
MAGKTNMGCRTLCGMAVAEDLDFAGVVDGIRLPRELRKRSPEGVWWAEGGVNALRGVTFAVAVVVVVLKDLGDAALVGRERGVPGQLISSTFPQSSPTSLAAAR